MTTSFVELHDSDVESVTIVNDSEAIIKMHLLIHKSEGRAGRDPGTEWMQHAEVRVKKFYASCKPQTESKWVLDGVLVLGKKAYENEMPMAFDHSGSFYLSFIYDDGESFSISGSGIKITWLGEATFLQKFK